MKPDRGLNAALAAVAAAAAVATAAAAVAAAVKDANHAGRVIQTRKAGLPRPSVRRTTTTSHIHVLHHLFGISVPGRDSPGRQFVQPRQISGTQLKPGRRGIFFQIFSALRPRYRHDVVALSQHPRERKLSRGHFLLASNFVYSLNQLEILREVFASEPRRIAPVIISGEIVEALDLTRQESAAERTVGNKANPKLANRLEDLIFRIAAPQRILGLKRADRMHRVRSADRFRSRLAQAEV